MEPNLSTVQGSPVGQAVLDQLARTRGWTRFFSVLLWIGAVFLVLGGLAMMVIGGMSGAFGGSGDAMAEAFGGAIGGIAVGAIYLVMAFFYIYPALKLGSYSSRINDLLATPNESNLATALNE